MPKFAMYVYVFAVFVMGVLILTSPYTSGLEVAIQAIQ